MMLRLLCAGLLLALAGCGGGKPAAPGAPISSWKDAPPQVVEQEWATGVVQKGRADGVDYRLLVMARTFESEGKVGVCAVTRLAAENDVSAFIREGFEHDRTALVIKAKNGGRALSISPRFVPVLYVQGGSAGDEKEMAVAILGDKPAGACIVTETAWEDRWAAGNYTARLALYTRDPRQRSQTVVGQ